MAAGAGGDFPGPPIKLWCVSRPPLGRICVSRPKPSINRSSCPHAILNKRDPWPTQPRPSLEIRYPRQKKTTSNMERSITFNLSSARDTQRHSFQFCRLGPLGSSGPSRRRRIPAFPRNLPPEECRIAPTPTSAPRTNGRARMGEIPCMLCLSSRTDGRTDRRVSQHRGPLDWELKIKASNSAVRHSILTWGQTWQPWVQKVWVVAS